MMQSPESFALQMRLPKKGVAPTHNDNISHMVLQKFATDALQTVHLENNPVSTTAHFFPEYR